MKRKWLIEARLIDEVLKQKKKWVVGFCLAGAVFLLTGTNLPRAIVVGDSVERAMSVGAAVKIPFRVVDENGLPVPNAKFMVGMWLWTVKENGADGMTDRDGMFTVRGKATDEVVYSIDKEGYYRTSGKYFLSQEPDAAVKGGQWMPYGKERVVVLKRIVNPIPMYAKPKWKFFYFPEINIEYGFDAFEMDWVEPFGKGKHVDIVFEYKGDGLSGMNYRDGHIALKWLDRNCGFYEEDIADSELKSSYTANTNNSYKSAISFVNQRDSTGRFVETANKYMVFRIRTRFSPDGRMIGAHYGKIYLPINFGYVEPSKEKKACFGINIYTNPTENDTNLEFFPYHSLNYPMEPVDKQPNIAP